MSTADISVSQQESPGLGGITQQIIGAVSNVVYGKDRLVKHALLVLLAGGHILLEDIPGVGKTTLAKALGQALGGKVRRVQCTPDLLPSDITGSSVFNQRTTEFEFHPGPIFGNVVIADEVNRAEPKTQSALLECMGEGQVTADGMRYQLPTPFTVVATQNPADMQGTFPLPEAQRDRFMAKLSVGYPEPAAELDVVLDPAIVAGDTAISPVTDVDTVSRMISYVNQVTMATQVAHYLVGIITATRTHPDIVLGASTRAAVHLGKAARALAAMNGRNHVLPDDVKELAPLVLAHRMTMAPHALGEGISATDVITDILTKVPSDQHIANLSHRAPVRTEQTGPPRVRGSWR